MIPSVFRTQIHAVSVMDVNWLTLNAVKQDWLNEIPLAGLNWEAWQSAQAIGELPLFIAAMKQAYLECEVRLDNGRIYQTT